MSAVDRITEDVAVLPPCDPAAVQAKPWERQPNESARAFEAFALYRDLGPSRSVRTVASELDKSASLIGRWSTAHHWNVRAMSWDGMQDERRREAESDALERMSDRHARALQAQIDALARPGRALIARLAREPTALEGLELSMLVELVSKVARPLATLIEAERAARGVSGHDDGVCCPHEAAHRRAASMTRSELEAMLVGRPMDA